MIAEQKQGLFPMPSRTEIKDGLGATAPPVRRLWTALVLAVAIFSGFGLSACGDAKSEAKNTEPSVPAIPVSIEVVKPVTLKDVMVLPGTAESYQDVLLAAELDGQVQWTGVREGDEVKKGQLLAKIDVDSNKAAMKRAQAAYDLARGQAERRQKLHERKVVSQEDLDKALTQKSLAENDLQQAKIAYDKGFVHSPIPGMVNKFYVDPGEYVRRGDPLAEIVDVARIRLKCNVPEMDVRYLKKGQHAMVFVDAFPDEKHLGSLSFVAYKADPVTKTFEVWVDVDNQKGHIRPGMIGRAAFLRREIEGALTVPLTALVDKGGERNVFVEKDGKAEARKVEIGVISLDRAQILEGLNVGDRLVVQGQKQLEEGMRVSLQ
jgi:membrane fusion protein, multidrug efflux system